MKNKLIEKGNEKILPMMKKFNQKIERGLMSKINPKEQLWNWLI